MFTSWTALPLITNLLLDECTPLPDAPASYEDVPVSPEKEAWILKQANLWENSVSNGADLIVVSNEPSWVLSQSIPWVEFSGI